jgi:hypothetical protein
MRERSCKVVTLLSPRSIFILFISFILIFTLKIETSFAQTAGTFQQPGSGFTTYTGSQLQIHDSEFPEALMVPKSNFFSPTRPKIIILLHGATNTPDNDMSPKDENGNVIIGTLKFPRYYWGFYFARSLLGTTGSDLYTFSNARLNANNWPEGAYDTPVPGISRLPTVAVSPAVNKRDYLRYVQDHFISTSSTRRDLSLMLTHRDGSRSLSEQADKAVNQIFEFYNRIFSNNNEPQIILIAHSMGGLVSRYILSNPFNSASKNWFRANFIRNRTICLLTLATPHEGSPLADKLQQIANLVDTRQPWVVNIMRPLEGLGVTPRKLIDRFLGASDPDIYDLKVPRLLQLNRSVIAPQMAARNDGTLIPIYAISGRDPSNGRLNQPHLPQIAFGNDIRNKMDTAGLVLIDQAFKIIDSRGYGPPPSGSANVDWIQRVSLQDIIKTNKTEVERLLNNNACLKLIVNRLGGIIRTSGLTSFDFNFPVYLDKKWMARVVWKDVPFKHWECGSFRIPWDDMKNFDIVKAVDFLIKNLKYNLQQLAGCATDPRNWQFKNTIKIPTIGLVTGSGRPFDNERDNDGMVGFASGLGLTLGQNYINYFDHTKQWAVGTNRDGTPRTAYGSWYRFYSGLWDKDNHGTILRNGGAANWIFNKIVRSAGPVSGPGPLSYYIIPRPITAPALRR